MKFSSCFSTFSFFPRKKKENEEKKNARRSLERYDLDQIPRSEKSDRDENKNQISRSEEVI